jgi:hypothetical protein
VRFLFTLPIISHSVEHDRCKLLHKQTGNERWVTFTYNGREVKFITNLFKDPSAQVLYGISNTPRKIEVN